MWNSKALGIIEWIIGFVSIGILGNVFFIAIFASDDPSFFDRLSPLQNFACNYLEFVVLIIPAVFFICFIARFFWKSVPWHHVAGIAGIVGIIYATIVLSACFPYFFQNL